MQTCPQCGFHATDKETRCVRCGAWLRPLGDPDPLADPAGEALDRRRLRSPRWRFEAPARLMASLRRQGRKLNAALNPPVPDERFLPRPWLAGLLGLAPGMGQLYVGHRLKAGLWLLGDAGWLVVLAGLFPAEGFDFALWGLLATMLLSVHDAVMSARRTHGHIHIWQHHLAYFCAWGFYAGVAIFLMDWATGSALSPIQVVRVGPGPKTPAIADAEEIIIDRASFWVGGQPRQGEWVYYDPPVVRLRIFYQGSMVDKEFVNLAPIIGWVAAGPGVRVERDGEAWCLDGELPPAQWAPPYDPGVLPRRFSVEAPPGHVVILTPTKGVLGPSGALKFIESQEGNPWQMVDPEEFWLVPVDSIQGRLLAVKEPAVARRWVR